MNSGTVFGIGTAGLGALMILAGLAMALRTLRQLGWAALTVPFGFMAMGLIFLIVGGLIWYGSQPPEW